MGKISVFNHVTVDGFYASSNGGIDWFKSIAPDDEFNAFTHSASSAKSTLIYGWTTYEMMHAFWPTEEALKMDPQMANAVNESPKLVFSKKLRSVEEEPHWKNIQLRSEIDGDEIRRMKASTDMTILGSGTIVQQLAELHLIDDYTLIQVPIVLGAGKSMFDGVSETNLELVESRAFKNGLVLLHYRSRGE